MFFAQEIVGKKGALAIVWRLGSSHSLSKRAVLRVDVEVAVETIKAPQVPLALRALATLLYGVAVAHGKKTTYLEQDCHRYLSALKRDLLARDVTIDLPEHQQTTRFESITLPEDPIARVGWDTVLLSDGEPLSLSYSSGFGRGLPLSLTESAQRHSVSGRGSPGPALHAAVSGSPEVARLDEITMANVSDPLQNMDDFGGGMDGDALPLDPFDEHYAPEVDLALPDSRDPVDVPLGFDVMDFPSPPQRSSAREAPSGHRDRTDEPSGASPLKRRRKNLPVDRQTQLRNEEIQNAIDDVSNILQGGGDKEHGVRSVHFDPICDLLSDDFQFFASVLPLWRPTWSSLAGSRVGNRFSRSGGRSSQADRQSQRGSNLEPAIFDDMGTLWDNDATIQGIEALDMNLPELGDDTMDNSGRLSTEEPEVLRHVFEAPFAPDEDRPRSSPLNQSRAALTPQSIGARRSHGSPALSDGTPLRQLQASRDLSAIGSPFSIASHRSATRSSRESGMSGPATPGSTVDSGIFVDEGGLAVEIVPDEHDRQRAASTSTDQLSIRSMRLMREIDRRLSSTGKMSLALDSLLVSDDGATRASRRMAAKLFFEVLVLSSTSCLSCQQVDPYASVELARGPAFVGEV